MEITGCWFLVVDTLGCGRVVGLFASEALARTVTAIEPLYYKLHRLQRNQFNLDAIAWETPLTPQLTRHVAGVLAPRRSDRRDPDGNFVVVFRSLAHGWIAGALDSQDRAERVASLSPAFESVAVRSNRIDPVALEWLRTPEQCAALASLRNRLTTSDPSMPGQRA